jgi:hypothetical protein
MPKVDVLALRERRAMRALLTATIEAIAREEPRFLPRLKLILSSRSVKLLEEPEDQAACFQAQEWIAEIDINSRL